MLKLESMQISRRLVALVVGHKVILLLATALIGLIAPTYFNASMHNANVHWPAGGPDFWSHFSTWDSNFYLAIADHGYSQNGVERAFYPLYPLLIRMLGITGGRHLLICAVLIASACSCLASFLLFDLVRGRAGEAAAWLVTLMFLTYPGAYVLAMAYSEGLFVFLFALLLYGLANERRKLVLVAAFLLPLCRSTGILCAVPLAVDAWLHRDGWRPSPWLQLLAPLAGFGAYLLVMFATTGNAFSGFIAASQFIFHPSVANLLDPVGFVRALVHIGSFHGFLDSFIDRLFFVVSLSSLWLLRRQKLLLLTAAAFIVVSGAGQHFSAYVRFLAVILPVFIAWGEALAGVPRRAVAALFVVLFACQLGFLAWHTNDYWVASRGESPRQVASGAPFQVALLLKP